MFPSRAVSALVGTLLLLGSVTARPGNWTGPVNITVPRDLSMPGAVRVPDSLTVPSSVTLPGISTLPGSSTVPNSIIAPDNSTAPSPMTVFVTIPVIVTKLHTRVTPPPPATVTVHVPRVSSRTSVNLLSTSFPTVLRTILYPTNTGKYHDVSALYADADVTLLPANLRSIVTELGHRPTIAPDIIIPMAPNIDMGGSPKDKWPLPDIGGVDTDPKPQEPILWGGHDRRILREAINAALTELNLARAHYRKSQSESNRLWSLFHDKCDWAPEDCIPPTDLLQSTWDQAEAADEVAKADLRRIGRATYAVLVARRNERDWQDRMQRSWGDAYTTFLLQNGPPSVRVEEPTGLPVRQWEGGVGDHKRIGW